MAQVSDLFFGEGSFLPKKHYLHYSRNDSSFTFINLKYIIFWFEYTLDTSHCEHDVRKQDHVNLLGKGCYLGQISTWTNQ